MYKATSKYTHIFFDLDNTLWDFSANASEALNELYEIKNLKRFFNSFEHFLKIYVPKNKELWELYAKGKITKGALNYERFAYPLRMVGIIDDKLALSLGPDFLERTTNKKKLEPHALEVLEILQPYFKLAVLSNGFKEVQYTKIKQSGLNHFFKDPNQIILSDEIGYYKPDIRYFQKAMETVGAAPETSLLVGDNLDTDIKGAQTAKIDAIYYNKYHIELPNTFKQTPQIADLKEMIDFL